MIHPRAFKFLTYRIMSILKWLLYYAIKFGSVLLDRNKNIGLCLSAFFLKGPANKYV